MAAMSRPGYTLALSAASIRNIHNSDREHVELDLRVPGFTKEDEIWFTEAGIFDLVDDGGYKKRTSLATFSVMAITWRSMPYCNMLYERSESLQPDQMTAYRLHV